MNSFPSHLESGKLIGSTYNTKYIRAEDIALFQKRGLCEKQQMWHLL